MGRAAGPFRVQLFRYDKSFRRKYGCAAMREGGSERVVGSFVAFAASWTFFAVSHVRTSHAENRGF